MKNARSLTALLVSLSAVLILSSCAKQEEFALDDRTFDITEPIKTQAPTKSDTSDTEKEIRKFIFNSADEIESISDEDLIYIYTHYSAVLEQNSDREGEIDLFGVPLAEETIDGVIYREQVGKYFFDCLLSPEEINLNEPFPGEIFREYVDRYYNDMINYRKHCDDGSDLRRKDGQLIYCGENNLYVEYSIRFTEVRSGYENGKFVIRETPRAYRECFYKNLLCLEGRQWLAYFGELTAEAVKSYAGKALYNEISETRDAYICTSYRISGSVGDYGLCDSANLEKSVIVFDKKTHEIHNNGGGILKRADIPGTYHEPPEIW